MGTTRKLRKKYRGPSHPWRADRLAEEAVLKTEYGLKNKTEIYKTLSALKRFTTQAKRLIRSRTTPQAQAEEKQLLGKLNKLGLLDESAKLEDVLTLTIRDILDRRFQTLAFKQNFALTPKQARQLITHGHITINGKKLDVPSFLVPRASESIIAFNPISTWATEDHPERAKEKNRRDTEAAKTAAAAKKATEDAEELKKLEEIEKTVGAEVVQ